MNNQSLIFKILSPTYPELPSVMAASVDNPSSEKIQSVLHGYNNPDHNLLGCFINKQLIGIIGVETSKQTCTIKHLSIISEYQHKGIGRQCIEALFSHFNIQLIKADTDDDAVGFYRAVKFEYHPFNGPYGQRYHCNRKIGSV